MKRRHFLRAAGILPLGAAAAFVMGREKAIEGVFPAQDVDPESRSESTLERQHFTPAHAAHLVPGSDKPEALSPSLTKLIDALDFSAVYDVYATHPGHDHRCAIKTHTPIDVVRIGPNIFLTSTRWEPYLVSSKAQVEVDDRGILITSPDHLGYGVSRCHLRPETYEKTLERLNEKYRVFCPEVVATRVEREGIKQIELAAWFDKEKSNYPGAIHWTPRPETEVKGIPYPADKPRPRFIHQFMTPTIAAETLLRNKTPYYNGYTEQNLMSHQTAMLKMSESVDKAVLDQVDRYRKGKS
jgi:hypothetical protein